jgi:hypothetical protein
MTSEFYLTEWETKNPLTLIGGNRPYNLMSILYGAHSIGEGILGFCALRDANNLRLTCKELRDEVNEFRWMDMKTRINGSLQLLRTCFPLIRGVNLTHRFDLTAADFQWLRGIKHLIVCGDDDPDDDEIAMHMTFPDAAFEHIHGIESLDISDCNQLTDAAFVHLKGIHTLKMSNCHQGTITDAAFAHLPGIHTLDMGNCGQITDTAFTHLTGIHTLNIDWCIRQDGITNAAFIHLKGIHTLNMSNCNQITDAAFVHLKGIHTLNMSYCDHSTITDTAFTHLKGIHTLNMRGCNQETITDTAFTHLKGIHTLNMHSCDQDTLTDAIFSYIKGVRVLDMDNCRGIERAALASAVRNLLAQN